MLCHFIPWSFSEATIWRREIIINLFLLFWAPKGGDNTHKCIFPISLREKSKRKRSNCKMISLFRWPINYSLFFTRKDNFTGKRKPWKLSGFFFGSLKHYICIYFCMHGRLCGIWTSRVSSSSQTSWTLRPRSVGLITPWPLSLITRYNLTTHGKKDSSKKECTKINALLLEGESGLNAADNGRIQFCRLFFCFCFNERNLGENDRGAK